MKQLIKQFLRALNISITRNQRYDSLTRKILRKKLNPSSGCIDVGCHTGEILDLMLRWAPEGKMYGFEPVPSLSQYLHGKYAENPRVRLCAVALSDVAGETTFQHVLNAPAYSGIKRRNYDGKKVEIREITVPMGRMDEFIPQDERIDLIKIDVEGAELQVLKGASETIRRNCPMIIFEFGKGASDCYGTTPEQVFSLVCDTYALKLNTLKGYLQGRKPLSEKELVWNYNNNGDYYFIAYP